MELKKLIHKFKNLIKVFIFSNFKNTIFTLKKINKDEIIVHHHLGLVDAIICNGIINLITEKSIKVNIPVLKKNYDQLSFLYSENDYVNLFTVENENTIYKNSKQILRLGFEKNFGFFNSSFYKQLDIPYEYSFEYFKLPINTEKEQGLEDHLFDFYKIKKDYILVHRTSSYGTINLKLNKNLPIIYVEKDSDIYKNIFYYRSLILNATEIHCIDSSFLHLVERVDTNAKLFFHNLKKENQGSEKLELYKNWNIII